MDSLPDNHFSAPRRKSFRVVDGGEAIARSMPHSIEAEENLLSCCLIDGATVLARCANAVLTDKSFYVAAHAVIFARLQDMARKNIPVAIDTLAEELKAVQQLEAAGGFDALVKVSSRTPTTMQAGYFIEKVRSLELMRSGIRGGQGIAEEIYELKGDLPAFLSAWALKFQRLADLAMRGKHESLRDRLTKRLEATLAAAAGKVDRTRWLTTGLPWLDTCILPFDVKQEDWYVIVAAGPSGGKSSFMRKVAVHNCDQGKRGAIFLLETGLRWADAAAATTARVNLRDIDRAPRERLTAFKERYEQLNTYAEERLWIFEDLVFVEDIERQIREINRTLLEKDLAAGVPADKARGLDFVVIDYLQLVTTRQNLRGHREQIVAHVSMSFKRLFKTLDITGFVGAQINRSSREDNKPPTLGALRESGAIEQDADRVIFLHTPELDRAGNKQDGNKGTDEVEVIQRKSRNGPRDVLVTVLFHKQYTDYEAAAHKGDARPGIPKPPTGYKRETAQP